MIDMHTHILPGVDDGASDMEESICIIETAINEGIDTIVLTPHIRDDLDWKNIDKINKTYLSLKKECLARSLNIHLVLGAEILLIPTLIDRLKENPSVCFGKGELKYVLVEFPFYQFPLYTEDVLFKMLTENYIPIIAHPERYLYLNNKFKNIKKWAENGVVFQINTGSLNGQYGIRVKRFAKKLLKNGLVYFLGSDVHYIDKNLCSFNKAFKIASKITGEAQINVINLAPEV